MSLINDDGRTAINYQACFDRLYGENNGEGNAAVAALNYNFSITEFFSDRFNSIKMSLKENSVPISVVVAVGAVGLGALSYQRAKHNEDKKYEMEKYLDRVHELSMKVTNYGRSHKVKSPKSIVVSKKKVVSTWKKLTTSDHYQISHEFREIINAQVRTILGVRLPGNLEIAQKFGYHGGHKCIRDEKQKGVFVKAKEQILAGQVVALFGGKVYTNNFASKLKMVIAGDKDHHVSFVDDSANLVFTVNGLEQPTFKLKHQANLSNMASHIRTAPDGHSANVFFYGPVVLKNCGDHLPCAYATESIVDKEWQSAPVIAAVALREIGANQELFVDSRIGVCPDNWYSDILESAEGKEEENVPNIDLKLPKNISSASTAPTPLIQWENLRSVSITNDGFEYVVGDDSFW